jgi:uncharacterized RDD family membrane protein YckC
MNTIRYPKILALILATWLAASLALQAQTPVPPAAPPAEAPTAQPVAPAPDKKDEAPAPPATATPAEAPAAPTPAATPAVETEKKSDQPAELRRLDQPGEEKKPVEKSRSKRAPRTQTRSDGPPFGNHTVPAGKEAGAAVSVFGSSTVDGKVNGETVSVFGNTTINGETTGEAVSVFGVTTINGRVGGQAVAVFGDLVLGPKAVVKGDAVVVLGKLKRAEGAEIGGTVTEVGSFGSLGDFSWVVTYFKKCVLLGRPLAIGKGLGWAWVVAGSFLLFYLLLALLFPRGIERCVEVLEQRPGNTVLAAFLTALLTPIVIILLVITGIGLVLVPFVAAGLFFGGLFGKAAVFAWLGRRITVLFGEGIMRHAVVAVFFGGVLVTLLYMVPFLGFLLYKLFGILGMGMVVYALILSMKRDKPAPARQVIPGAGLGAMPVAMASAGAAGIAEPTPLTAGAPGVEGAAPPPVAAPVHAVPPGSATTLPRAGFWIRIAASFLDALLIGVAAAMIHWPPGFMLLFAVYCVVLWATKGSTIGGVVCGLKVVRLDDRPVDWGVAVVRALGGFLSLAVVGLGFIWVAFDDEKQSWHDKIAGTTIVKVPKGTPLI